MAQGMAALNVGIPPVLQAQQLPQQGYQQPQDYQQQPQQPLQQQQPAYGGYQPQPAAAESSAMYGGAPPYGQPQQQALPLNQLYQTDLLRDLPPPITDLSLPPPPVIIPPSASVIPNNPNANASSDVFRSTLNAVPNSSSLLKKSKLPFALVIRPYTSLHDSVRPVPEVNDMVIARCRRCRGYINPFIEFTEQGRRWRCNFCSLQNDVPAAFDHSQQFGAVNRYDRNELNHAVVEFIAPQEYMIRPPQPLIYVFVIDVSVASVKSGLLATVATTILESLDRIPNKDNRTRVAFIGVDSALHYFSIPQDSEPGEASIFVVPDLDEPFTPSPDSLLVNLAESRQNIEKLLANLNNLFISNLNPSFALGPALKSAHKLVEGTGGKIITLASTLPNIGVGKLVVRDEASFVDKPKEASALLTANDAFYKSFAVDCNKSQVTLEFFLTSASYQDVASLANLPRYTAGQTHYYPAWSATSMEDVTKLSKELSNVISQDIALEAVFRTRGSSGLTTNTFYGNFFSRSSDLCAFSTFPRDQSYVIEIAIEETLTKPIVYFQTAVLHTTIRGERRIRVITAAIPTTSNISEVFASADQLAITNYLAHKAIQKAYNGSFNDARDLLSKHMLDILTVFKKEVVAGNVGGSSPLMLSTNLRMLPLLLHSLTKHMGLRPGRVPADHRANALNLLGSLPLPQLIRYIYPTVYSLHDMLDEVGLPDEETGEILLPTAINSSAESFERYGLYLINTTAELFLWIGGDAVPELVNDVFGVPDIFQVAIGKVELPELANDFNQRVRNIISRVREGDDTSIYENLYVVRGGSANEPLTVANAKEVTSFRIWAASQLVEDRIGNQGSYREYLASIKDKISA
jgi:protein transport protein SEC24